MNSLRSVYRALEYEEKRQREVLRAGGTITQSTRHWDEKAAKELRTKEEAFDSRYFPEPDLVSLEPAVERAKRYERELGLTPYDAGVLRSTKAVG